MIVNLLFSIHTFIETVNEILNELLTSIKSNVHKTDRFSMNLFRFENPFGIEYSRQN